ncbi:hypothetical protein HID58_033307 [Brassica napus]|uniref:Uncharacterized protein n=1 Tax=Brassica napus TaxID=3708 RepID=A0ABQ8BYV6_BRANA|nr:hypothetical protein HID58_033307 [Brassica napus]
MNLDTIENRFEFLDSWCDSLMVEDEELERLIRRTSLRSEVETESLNKVTAPTLHQTRHDGDLVT